MNVCRFCGGPAEEVLRKSKGRICRPCCRKHVWGADNQSRTGKARQHKYEAEHGLARRRRRVYVGRRYVGKVNTATLARTINEHIKKRRREFTEGSG